MDRFGNRPADPAYAAFQRGLYITALNLALPKAEQGDRAAQMLTAEIHARGLGVPRNMEEATRWYMLAAEQGDAEAQLQVAMILLGDKPLDLANPNRAEAMDMLRASAETGNPYAAFNLAQLVMAEQPGDDGARQARILFETAATRDIPGALYALARFHLTGIGGATIDGAKARDLMTRAARAGLDTAQLDLATSLADGVFGKADYTEAFIWMRRAALGGNPLAANRLAKLYMFGLGNDGDPIAAAAWYIRAKRAGIKDAEMEDYLEGLTDDQRSKALTAANAPL
ncbi:MAG: sel1 repeat family protein [Phyllobacteriaceae bacterium]|nr:sel1 repeat family protein [Phyllobacteriaceae bacterium]